MNFARSALLICFVMFVVLAVGCSSATEEKAGLTPDSPQLKAFAPVPAVMEDDSNPITEQKVDLGRMLYYEPRLSKGQDISCNDCHELDKYGVDGEPTSDGHKGQRGDRNSPSVYHAAGHFSQFWDGREPNVEEQAKGPILNPVEMALASDKDAVKVLKSIPEYVSLFKAAFPDVDDPVTYDNMAKAIGAFERKLVTPARWDSFLEGDATALTEAELDGLNEFLGANCQTCHMGPYLGGGLFQKLGIVKAWPDDSDTGRHKVTGNESEKMMFKVPSLRNVAETGPYFHDGKVPALHEAVGNMAEYELGSVLTPEQIDSIVVFLESLTGEIPVDYIQKPELPPSSPTTPKPDLSD
jgi:cytochrome c peroxidase